MKLGEFRKLIDQLGPEHDDRDVLADGCDCVGDCLAIDATGAGDILLSRQLITVGPDHAPDRVTLAQ